MADSSQAQPDASPRIEELAELVRQQAEAIQGLKTQLSKQITREIANTTQQLEAHQALQALISDLPAPLHGWPISPDFALQLVRLIRDHCYDLIIEFGSGTSTLLCLRALEQFRQQAPQRSVLIQINDAGPRELLRLRWQAALRLCQQRLVGRPAAVVSVVPELEEAFRNG